jgi:hypothetical protein
LLVFKLTLNSVLVLSTLLRLSSVSSPLPPEFFPNKSNVKRTTLLLYVTLLDLFLFTRIRTD